MWHLVAHCFESTAGRYKIKFNDIHKNNMYFPLDNLIRLYLICSLPDKHNFLLKCLLQFCIALIGCCLLYTSDAADDMQCVDLGGRRIIKKA